MYRKLGRTCMELGLNFGSNIGEPESSFTVDVYGVRYRISIGTQEIAPGLYSFGSAEYFINDEPVIMWSIDDKTITIRKRVIPDRYPLNVDVSIGFNKEL